MDEFVKELEKLLDRFSIDELTNTQDYILAEYLRDCIFSFAHAVSLKKQGSKQ